MSRIGEEVMGIEEVKEVEEAKEAREAKEAKDETVPVQFCQEEFSVPQLPLPHLLPLFPLLRRMVHAMQFAGTLAFMVAILSFGPILSAQTAPALSHDLSGVWMQYPDGNVPGVPGMNAVSNRTRPPLTAWGQAKFDAAKPLVGPRAVPGVENNPELRCEPDGPPKLLNLPNPFEIVQIPGRVLMFFELGHIWRTIWTDGRPLTKDPDPSWLGYSVRKWEG